MDPTQTHTAAPRPATDLNPRTDPPLDFPDADYGELGPEDYDTLGFMCGLEVHQQLNTTSKLFCRCPAGVRTTRVDAEVLRHMRPTLSELGEYDGTALMEFKTRKEIVYQLERGSVCTYEMDDTPPFEIDPEAVRIALLQSSVMDMNLVSELHVMRKQYLDGSIPTGFQRTTMIALGGEVPFPSSELGTDQVIRIRQLSLEEDSCREVTDVGHRIVFRTDRLGMSLTETVTEPDLLTPEDVRRGAELLAGVAHATGHARRGAGAARQDVNVSIAGGRRVEIKGVSSHRILPRLVHIEAFRQLNLLRIRAELLARGMTSEDLAISREGLPWDNSDLVADARPALRKCEFAPVQLALEDDEMIAGVRLPGFGGLMSHSTQPGMNFSSEFRGRLQVIACLTGRPFMIHSGVEYGLMGSEWAQIRKALGAGSRSEDAVIVVWGPERDVATGCREILERAADALVGVPSETRQAFDDATTGFERILPGADRMYPDTDTPPVPVPDPLVSEIQGNLPERPWDRTARYETLGLKTDAARELADAPWAPLFDVLSPANPEAARRLAAGLQKRLVQHSRETGHMVIPEATRLAPLVRALEDVSPLRHAFEWMLLKILRDPRVQPETVLAEARAGDPSGATLPELASRIAKTRSEVRTLDPEAILRWSMGQLMRPLLGAAEPLAARSALSEALGVGEEGS